jgi:hypothetical protein
VGTLDCTTYGDRNEYRMDRKKGLERNIGERRERDKQAVYKGRNKLFLIGYALVFM